MTPKLFRPRLIPLIFLLICSIWLIQFPAPMAHARVAQKSSSLPGQVWLIPVTAPALLVRDFEQSLNRYAKGHRGLDYSVTQNQPLFAPANGQLAFSGQVGGKPVVAIAHDSGFKTAFEPACSDVPLGTPLIAGEPFARACPWSGYKSHCAPWFCLHFSLRHNGEYLSPLALIGGIAPSHTVSL